MKEFDGSTKIEGRMFSVPKTKYKIEITLKDKDKSSDFGFTKTSPPMPANLGGWAIMKKDKDLYFFYNTDLNEGANIKFDRGEMNTLKVEADERTNRTRFFLNDELVSVKKYYTRLKAHYRLGIGFEERFWKGDIKRVSIYGDNNNQDWVNLLLI
jgi:hypothetical protein